MSTAREATNQLVDLLRREHHALAEFLVALATFDAEHRWVELGYRSLFHFLTRELGLPNGPAYYRKTAAELIQRYPELVEPLRDGRLNLTSVVELSKVITPENRAVVLPRFFHTSKREAKEVSAALLPAPAPALRTVVTRVHPATDPFAVTGTAACVGSPVAAASGHIEAPVDLRSASQVLPEEAVRANATIHDVAPVPAPARTQRPRSEMEPLTADLRRLHLTVSRRLLDKLATARDALSHSHPGASEDEILEVGLDLILERQAKRRGLVKNARSAQASDSKQGTEGEATVVPVRSGSRDAAPAPTGSLGSPLAPRSRYVPAWVRRAVWKRDQGKCQWPVEGGGICGSTCQVELDHIDGFALGGATTPERCRILCRPHQDVHARTLYGDAVMNTYTRPKGNRCSEPVAAWAVSGAWPRREELMLPGRRPGRCRAVRAGAAPYARRPPAQ